MADAGPIAPRYSVALLGSQEWLQTDTVGPSIGRDGAGLHSGPACLLWTVQAVQVGGWLQ